MANIVPLFGLYVAKATTDTITGPVYVSAINIVCGATGGTTTIKVLNDTIWTGTPATASTTDAIVLAAPSKISDISFPALGSNVTVNVWTTQT